MAADLIMYHGKVMTGDGKDGYTICSAVAVQDDKILAIGTDKEILALADEKTELIDCEGNSVLPGLCDAHCHGSMTGSYFFACHLQGAETLGSVDEMVAEIQKRLREFIAANPDETIIRGEGFNQFAFPTDRRPSRADLDAVCSDKPIVIESFCRHALWVNTKALELAGITAETAQPEVGGFDVEEDGYPHGVFHEMLGIAMITENLPGYAYGVEDYKKVLLRYQEDCILPYGITLIQECMSTPITTEAYKQLAKEGKLKFRVRSVYDVDHLDQMDEITYAVDHRRDDVVSDLFAINTVKYFLEGFFTMEEPFEPEYNKANGMPEDYCGERMWDDQIVIDSFEKALKNNLQIHIHAMGDASVHQAIDCLVKAQDETGIRNRGTVAHVMLLDEEHKKKMGENELIASVQPRWMVYDNDIHSYFPMIGQKRAEMCYPDRSLSDAGAIVAYGTDFPVTPPPNPYHGMHCAVNRSVFPDAPDYEPNKGLILGPDQDASAELVAIEEAIVRNSRNGAYQMFLEKITGSIIPGLSAELILLDRDILTCPSSEIYSTKVRRTIFKGETVYKGE